MASIHALTGQARIVALRNGAPGPLPSCAAQESFFIEDGWVFREHHGKYVECICRTEEMPAAHGQSLPGIQVR